MRPDVHGRAFGTRIDIGSFSLPACVSVVAISIERSLHQSMESSSEMTYRTLGTTGEKVSAIGLGGWHIGWPKIEEKVGIRIIHSAIDRGITFLDNCWDYNEGISEIRMGKALRENGSRSKVFLMTKIDGRTKKEAARQIEHSLERMQTDCIDL